MTSPQSPDPGQLAQVLLKLGEMGIQLAHIEEQLKAVPDHETRLRSLERFRFTIAGGAFFGGLISGGVGYWIGHLVH